MALLCAVRVRSLKLVSLTDVADAGGRCTCSDEADFAAMKPTLLNSRGSEPSKYGQQLILMQGHVLGAGYSMSTGSIYLRQVLQFQGIEHAGRSGYMFAYSLRIYALFGAAPEKRDQ